jgi:hypothetical protein
MVKAFVVVACKHKCPRGASGGKRKPRVEFGWWKVGVEDVGTITAHNRTETRYGPWITVGRHC